MSKILIIVAKSTNNVIGKDNDIPWYISKDLIMFKKHTINSSVIMGRKTYESIPKKYRPLKDRTNIVLTRDSEWNPCENIIIASSMKSALSKADKNKDIYIIGGEQVYKEAIKFAEYMYITEVDAIIEGSNVAKFPEFNNLEWKEVIRINNNKEDKDTYNYSFVTYKRIN